MMPGWLIRTLAMAVKELRVVLLDKRARTTLVLSPILQLALFGLATTLEVKNIDLGVVNRDNGIAAERMLAALGGSRNIRSIVAYDDLMALNRAIDHREVIAGLSIPSNLSREVAAGKTGEIGLLLDGRRINAAQIVNGYLREITQQAGAELRPIRLGNGPQLNVRHWFNPNLDYRWFTMPGMITIITTVLMLSISAQSMARERELGTFDQLMALPLRRMEMLIGKVAPAFLVGWINAMLYVIVIPLIYGVPLLGSVWLLLAGMTCFALAITGIGLCISALAQSQQQAFLGGFLVIVPLILLSGYASPVDNMPEWLKSVAWLDPLSHMLLICEGTFLKAISFSTILRLSWPMILVAGFTLPLAGWLFRFRSE
jgi:ABC-2 type transport system permease protein